MPAFLDKLLDLPRELRLGTTWLALATLAVAADAYAIGRFDRSLLSILAHADELLAMPRRLDFLLPEGVYALAALVAFWFFVLPMMAFLWRQLILSVSVHVPSWLERQRSYPSPSKGWHWVPAAQIRAIEENNGLLYQACNERTAEGDARNLQMRCVLATMALSLLAFVQSTSGTGPCLLDAFFAWVDGLAFRYQVMVLPWVFAALWVCWALLMDWGGEFDGHIRLSEPPPKPTPSAYASRSPR
jgi:hypothetical protein